LAKLSAVLPYLTKNLAPKLAFKSGIICISTNRTIFRISTTTEIIRIEPLPTFALSNTCTIAVGNCYLRIISSRTSINTQMSCWISKRRSWTEVYTAISDIITEIGSNTNLSALVMPTLSLSEVVIWTCRHTLIKVVILVTCGAVIRASWIRSPILKHKIVRCWTTSYTPHSIRVSNQSIWTCTYATSHCCTLR